MKRPDPLGRPPLLLLAAAGAGDPSPAGGAAGRHAPGDRLARASRPSATPTHCAPHCGSACRPRRRPCWSASLLGLPVAWLLARVDFRGRALVRVLVAVPMVLPPVVAGVALRTAFGRTGLLGEPLLERDRLRVPVHRRGAWCWPTSSCRCRSWCWRSRARCVRPTRSSTRRPRPSARPGGPRSAGSRSRSPCPGSSPGWCWAGLARWASSARPSPSTATTPARTQTMPTLIYVTRQSDQDAALSMSLVMLLVSVGVLVALRDHWLGTP